MYYVVRKRTLDTSTAFCDSQQYYDHYVWPLCKVNSKSHILWHLLFLFLIFLFFTLTLTLILSHFFVLFVILFRYPTLVDHYIPNLAMCLRDEDELVRKQTLMLLTQLIQEDYVKWKNGSLFFRFIVSLVDESPIVRQYGIYASSI
jgi:hypothetical protein